jgi:hypothetical protein
MGYSALLSNSELSRIILCVNVQVKELGTERRGRVGILRILDLGPETGYPVKYFMVFLEPFKQMPWQCLKLGNNRFLPHSFLVFVH